MSKKFVSVMVAALLALSSISSAIAIEPTSITEQTVASSSYYDKLDQLEWIDYNDLDSLKYEDTYSYNELIIYLQSNGFTAEEALAYVGERPIETRSSSVRYSLMRLDTFSYSGGYKLQPRVRVGLEYLNGSSSPSRIVSLENPTMYTGGGSKCSFAGEVSVRLYSGNSFYYDFSGDLYKNGTVNWSVTGKIGIGEVGSAEGKITNGNGYITNVSDSGEYYSSSLNP